MHNCIWIPDRCLSCCLFAIVLSVLLRFTDSGYPLVSSNSSYSGNTIVWKFSIISENGILDIKSFFSFHEITIIEIRNLITNTWKTNQLKNVSFIIWWDERNVNIHKRKLDDRKKQLSLSSQTRVVDIPWKRYVSHSKGRLKCVPYST